MGEVITPIWGQKKIFNLHLVKLADQQDKDADVDWRCTVCGVDMSRDSADKDFWRYHRYVTEKRGHRTSADERYVACDKGQQKLL